MSAEGGPSGGGRAGIGSMSGNIGRGAGVGSIDIATPISSPITEHSTALSTISGKSGGSFDRSVSAADIFSAPEYRISQSAFNLDTTTPYSIGMPAEATLSENIDTMIQETAQDLTAEPATIINEVRYSPVPDESPVNESLSNIFQETVPLTAQYNHTDTAVRDLESLKTEFETLYVLNPEITTKEPETVKEAESAITQKPEKKSAQKAKAVFKEYAATYILPSINEIKTENKNQPETATETDSLLKVVDGEFQLAPQEVTKENQKQELKLTVKDQVELMTDVEQAVKTQELYVAIGYQTDAAAALATQALHKTLERKGLDKKLFAQVQHEVVTAQKTKESKLTRVEVMELTDNVAKEEVKKEQKRKTEEPVQTTKFQESPKAQAAREALNAEAITELVVEKMQNGKEVKISGREVIAKVTKMETEDVTSGIAKDRFADGSWYGSDGALKDIESLPEQTPEELAANTTKTLRNKIPVDRTEYISTREATRPEIKRVREVIVFEPELQKLQKAT